MSLMKCTVCYLSQLRFVEINVFLFIFISALLTVPPALAPTFQRVILQSGTMLGPKYIQDLQANWTQRNLEFREGNKIASSLILAENYVG
jgi:hypothetical protein